MVPALEFQRLVREIVQEISPDVCFQRSALHVLQEASEAYLVALFNEASVCASVDNRDSVTVGDLHLARRICG